MKDRIRLVFSMRLCCQLSKLSHRDHLTIWRSLSRHWKVIVEPVPLEAVTEKRGEERAAASKGWVYLRVTCPFWQMFFNPRYYLAISLLCNQFSIPTRQYFRNTWCEPLPWGIRGFLSLLPCVTGHQFQTHSAFGIESKHSKYIFRIYGTRLLR